MIAKHVPMRSVSRSDFSGLVKYLIDGQGKTERLGEVRTTNCEADNIEAVIAEVLATQHLNTRAKSDKTFHLLLSFRPGEKPDGDTLQAIEERICTGLGFGEHQRVSAVHHDTDNIHIHIAINKIHPTRCTMYEPYQFYRTLGDLCQVIEQEFGLEQDNHQGRRSTAEGRAADMEHHAGIESLLGWIKRECVDEIQAAQSWAELHQVLQNNGLELRPRANGFVIADLDGTVVKASSVGRDLSRPNLEHRLGSFEPMSEPIKREKVKREYTQRPMRSRFDTVELYARYKIEQSNSTTTRATDLQQVRSRRERQIDAARRSNRLRRASIKLMGGTKFTKKILYAQAHRALKDEIKAIGSQAKKERAALYEQYKRRAWADWLKQKAMEGDGQALEALRARAVGQGLKGDTVTGVGQDSPGETAVKDNITKKGTVIYRKGASAIRDDGEKLQLSRHVDSEGVKEALLLALERYGERITVNGSAEFKALTVKTAVEYQLPISFAAPGLERRRQQLLNQRESNSGRSETSGNRHGQGRFSRPSAGRTGSRTASSQRVIQGGRDATYGKPNVGGVGRVPPPPSQHRLRTLSQLGLVRIGQGSEVLLSRDVSHNLEQQRAKSNNKLRWGVFGRGLTVGQKHAAEKYIAEREEKRRKGMDISKHKVYNGQSDNVSFAGTRNVDGCVLALLKRGDEILVVPVDHSTAQRLRRLKVGDSVAVTPTGSIKKTKGRSL